MNAVAAPVLLIFLSSTSFTAARAVSPHADQIVFLFIRFLLVILLFAILGRNVPWPRGGQLFRPTFSLDGHQQRLPGGEPEPATGSMPRSAFRYPLNFWAPVQTPKYIQLTVMI